MIDVSSRSTRHCCINNSIMIDTEHVDTAILIRDKIPEIPEKLLKNSTEENNFNKNNSI